MDSSLRKIYILFLIIIILPSLIFTIYELSTFRQSEEVIEEIYNNQLDAILYSVNQYSEDVVSSWANSIHYKQNEENNLQSSLELMLNEMPSVQAIIQYDSLFSIIARANVGSEQTGQSHEIDSILTHQKATVDRLFEYIESGYRKIEPFSLKDGSLLILFITSHHQSPIINALILDSKAFINQVLDPKIQEIAGERFYISAFFLSDDNLIYSSNKQRVARNIEHRKTFWVLNDYYLGIEMKEKTISDLAWERSREDLIMIAIVEIVLLIGVWIIFRNVKKQMQLAQIKSNFVSNVSHEIRTPLALISMYIESLERGMVKTPDKVKEYYAILLQESQRLTSIVNKILNFSQIESGKHAFTYQSINLREVVNSVVSTFKLKLENQAFEWSVDVVDDDLQIVADKESVTDAIINLVDNAIKYSADVKKIDIRIDKEKDNVFVEIRDHGLGIPRSEQKNIYDKFYRVTDRNLAHKAKGSGIGLSIVKHIMDAHEGRISLKSKLGKGSSFRLYFPIIKISIP